MNCSARQILKVPGILAGLQVCYLGPVRLLSLLAGRQFLSAAPGQDWGQRA